MEGSQQLGLEGAEGLEPAQRVEADLFTEEIEGRLASAEQGRESLLRIGYPLGIVREHGTLDPESFEHEGIRE